MKLRALRGSWFSGSEEAAPLAGIVGSMQMQLMAKLDDKIPAAIAKELRTLAHDLSNALETIVQATYLVSQSNPPENSRRWVEIIDQASQQAVKINRKLRQILRDQS